MTVSPGPGPGSGAARQVLTLMSGTGLAQLIPIAISPLLTRLYAPADFGVAALYASVSAVLIIIGSARYELALLLPRDDAEGLDLLALALGINVVVSLLTLLLVLALGTIFAQWLGSPALGPWLLLMPLSVVFSGLINALTLWSNRSSAYRLISTSRVLQSAAAAGAMVALGQVHGGPQGLLIGAVLGQAVGAAVLLGPFWRRWGARLCAVRWRGARAQALRYREFPAVNLPHALLDALQASGVIALIGGLFGPGLLGLYSLGNRVLRTPMATVGSAVAQVFQKRVADALHHGGNVRALVIGVLKRLGLVALLVMPVLALAPALFAFVFGEAWREAGVYSQILGPWMLLNFLLSPLSQLPLLLGRQARALGYGVAYQVAMLAPLLAAWLLALSLREALLIQSIAASAVLLVYGAWLYRISGRGPLRELA